ncbi:Dihydroneopterin aldolase [Corynebacterium kutscheri]|uniref:7,8-dihydroneopterin aldolase n=1 Tax=Corynebacterium kutscheri TaxID=35755 RepID=A0A0F6QZI3_9CORY|nr:dihydroneopterin aldolase [Corynebacterium kutscheri]AKE40740.1 dihydroneopterin aldolase [Corynebacterium kutscheri]VEH04596.1 Dihydroneopterin aldolase [Corynebacterium kutscheri]VEH11138.1 Dihydroneopterin aldolase [Corynebacterium kutscheri]VEH80385.1 Dihydroneopterin aldolase [Corynebacterium kutscheri]
MIELKGLRAIGYHGVFEHEKREGQEFIVDIRLGVDIEAAGRSDDLSATVHYGELAELAHELIVGEPFDLIEKLAYEIAQAALARFPLINDIAVTVHKPHAPIPLTFSDVSVTYQAVR